MKTAARSVSSGFPIDTGAPPMKTLNCPGCARPMLYTNRQAGKRVRCSRCEAAVTLPGEATGVFVPDPLVGVAKPSGSPAALAVARRVGANPPLAPAAAAVGRARRAREALALGDDDRVIALCTHELADDPECVDALVNLAFALQRQNRVDEALARYEQLHELDSRNEVWARWIAFLEARRRAAASEAAAAPVPAAPATTTAKWSGAPAPAAAASPARTDLGGLIGAGVFWLLLGVVLTSYSYSNAAPSGHYTLWWGMVLLGAFQIVRGLFGLAVS
jgi:LSD1 subclass zinc finger protein